MIISMIAAVAANRVIGKDNDLAWNLPDDMRYFKKITKGHGVIMGRKNWESIPAKWRPLSGRANLIISRNSSYEAPGAIVHGSMEACVQHLRDAHETEAFIIGGGQIYETGLPIADKLYLTEINASPEGDTFFPDFNKDDWVEVFRESHPADNLHNFSFDFVIYRRRT